MSPYLGSLGFGALPAILGSVGGAAAGAFDLLQTEVLSASQASITFSSLDSYAGTYKHLQIRYTTRSNRASADSSVIGYFNSDQNANYAYHQLRAPLTGAVNSSGAASQAFFYTGECPAASTTSGVFSSGVMDILDPFDTSKYTTAKTLNGSTIRVGLFSTVWLSTSALTSMTFYTYAGDISQYSRFSLYGIKAA